MSKKRRALISCWDKTGLAALAQKLTDYNIEIISSGGTATYLQENKVAVTRVSDVTGYPEVLGGRVKTLHPLIHAPILAARSPEHLADLEKLNAVPIEFVIVNLYPFVEEASKKSLSLEKAIEYIDIGGPTLLRAASKNYQHVTALCRPDQYDVFLQELGENQGMVTEVFRRERAREVFFYTSWYDGQIQKYFSGSMENGETYPPYQSYFLEKKQDLRYGENPHQAAAVYQTYGQGNGGLAGLVQLWGKPLSFNNYADVEAAYTLILEFDDPGVAIIKHTNPCGAALTNGPLADAFEKALRGDSLSAFGGIVACNRPVDADTAERMQKIFFECIIAPGFDEAALEILQKKKNLRLLKLSPDALSGDRSEMKLTNNTALLQQKDLLVENRENWTVATERKPSDSEWAELDFTWKVTKHVKSNAIVFTRDREIYGVGAGQMSRVDSVKIAKMKAEQFNRDMQNLVMGSDAFFPFRDGIDAAAAAGVTAIIQPGGSIRDEEVVAAANEHDISMVFTGIRHFKH